MRIGIVGGTGSMGRGFALHWSPNHKVIIGSRQPQRARQARDEYLRLLHEHGSDGTIEAADNAGVVEGGDVVVLAVNYPHLRTAVESVAGRFDEQVVVSPVVPMTSVGEHCDYVPPAEGSAAVQLAGLLPAGCRVVAAFHTIPAFRLSRLGEDLDTDVPVCGDDLPSKRVVMALVREIPGARALDAGPLAAAGLLEAQTPLLFNLKRYNEGGRSFTMKFA